MAHSTLDGILYDGMLRAGAANLHRHRQQVNDLNVFPIPDGDTGDNMMLTVEGGVHASHDPAAPLSEVSERIANGMLLGARGNSGVILSQFFAGLAEGFRSCDAADVPALEKAFACGVGCAYESVMNPTVGTILTVVKDAAGYAAHADCSTVEEYFEAFIAEAKRSLDRTPDLLPVLKEAGVVDSGGAGLIHIVEGMYAFLCGNRIEDAEFSSPTSAHTVDPSLFTADSVMEFGYCTELLLRLQTAKTDPAAFDVGILTEYLQSIGDSVVTVKSDSIVKLHVHTMTPYKVLEFCQRFGEFLTVKIENMMLQHNETLEKEAHTVLAAKTNTKRRPFAVVAVAMGEGIRNSFSEMGADAVIEGGQTMNPSAEDFLNAFDEVNADTVFVLPNNGNILLAARQAAQMYAGSDVRVIPTHSIGDGYAVLSMLDPDSGNADRIEAEMNDAMQGVLTAEISQSIRNADLNGVSVHCGEYIGFIGKEIIASCPNREEAACRTLERMDLSSHGLVLVIRGKQTAQTDAKIVSDYIRKHYPTVEICESDGGQDVYDYILVAE